MAADEDPTPVDGTASVDEDDVADLKAERDELAHEVEVLHTRKKRKGRARGVLAVIGVVLSCILLLAACLGVFARRSFLKTDNFSNRAGSLIDDPGVQSALSAYLTEQLNQLIDPREILQDALPDRAQVLAVPLAGAVEGFIGDQVSTFVASDTFARLWKEAVELAHREVVRVLEGNTPLVEESKDHIVINLLPVINGVLAQISQASPEIFGRTVNLPTVTVDDVPDAARQAIGDALGVTLDDNFGTFTVYDNGALSSAQEAVKVSDKLVWLLVVLAPLAILGTLLVSVRRRRTLLQLTVGIAVTMVLLRRLVFLFQKDLLDYVRIERNVPAVEATSNTFLDPLTTGALWLGIGALVVAAIAALTGPYGWAVRLRTGTVGLGRRVGSAVSGKAEDPATAAWVAANFDKLRIAGAVVGIVLLWWIDMSWPVFFVLVALVGAYELVLARLAERAAPVEPDPVDATP
ncbi:MAG TPA: hypothetical protein VIT24_07530 [Acidimicrobiales bacterium]